MAYTIPARRGAPLPTGRGAPLPAGRGAPLPAGRGAPLTAGPGAALPGRLGSTLLPCRRVPRPHPPSPAPIAVARDFEIGDPAAFPSLMPVFPDPPPFYGLSYSSKVERDEPNDLQQVLRNAALSDWKRSGSFSGKTVHPEPSYSSSDELEFESDDEMASAEVPQLRGRSNILKGGCYKGKIIIG